MSSEETRSHDLNSDTTRLDNQKAVKTPEANSDSASQFETEDTRVAADGRDAFSFLGNESKHVILSIDAMGADRGVDAVVKGMAISAENNPEIAFIVHGDEVAIRAAMKKHKELEARVSIVHAEAFVSMEDKPSHVLRKGKNTSMFAAILSVKNKDARAVVSCGNTGALMALSMFNLRKVPGINRPAIAVLWPSHNPQRFNVLLDAGADIKADAEDLLSYAIMGASYARNGLGVAHPRIGLLNVGTEEHKGRPEIQDAAKLILAAESAADFKYVGYVEGNDFPSADVDVIVTDGFTGNVALKTGEGTARFIGDNLRGAFQHSIFTKIGALFAYPSLRRFRKTVDPRNSNGGVFLGLNGTVVKSHGGSDAIGISAAIKLAFQLAKNDFNERVQKRLESALEPQLKNEEDDNKA